MDKIVSSYNRETYERFEERQQPTRRTFTLPLPTSIDNVNVPTPPLSTNTSSSDSECIEPFDLGQRATFGVELTSTASNGEKMCAEICKEIFPNEQMLFNYRHCKIVNPDTHAALEFDIFIPALLLAIEFQGQQHYASSGYFGTRPESQIARDHTKAYLAVHYGIFLITIPYTYTPDMIRNALQYIKPKDVHVAKIEDIKKPMNVADPPPDRAGNVARVSRLFRDFL
jgi:hypothetical protein